MADFAQTTAIRVTVDAVEVTGVESCRIKRGRRTRFGDIDAGTVSVRAIVGTDPLIPDVLGKKLVVEAQDDLGAWVALFTGYCAGEDWDEPDIGAKATITYTGRDESARLGGRIAQLSDTIGDGELPGARINRLLDAAGVTGPRAIGPGRTPLVGTNLGNDVKQEIDAAALADLGVYFVAKDGTHVFYDSTQWHDTPSIPNTIQPSDRPGAAVQYQDYSVRRGIENVGNRVTGSSRSGGYTALREDAPSQATYGVQLAAFTLPSDDPLSVDWVADNVLANVKDSAVELVDVSMMSAWCNNFGTIQLHDDLVNAEIGSRIIFERGYSNPGGGSTIDLDLVLSYLAASWDPQTGWQWTISGWPRMTITPRYDPILSPAWNRYYMADGPRALTSDSDEPVLLWPDEYHYTAPGPDEGLDTSDQEAVLQFEPSPVINNRRVAFRTDTPRLSDFGASFASLPSTGTYTVVWIGALVGIPARNTADLGAANIGLVDISYNNISAAWQSGWNVDYQGQTPQEVELVHRPTDNGAWTAIPPRFPIVGGQGGDAQVALIAVYTAGSNVVRYEWWDGTQWATGNYGASGSAPGGGPVGSLALPFIPDDQRGYVRCALYAAHNGDMIQTPTTEFATWRDWVEASYGLS